MKKIISIICCVILAFSALSLTGCRRDKYGNKTKIYVELKSGGTGIQWLKDAGERFADYVGDKSYEKGKKGVVVLPSPVDNPSLKNAETSGTAIYDLMSVASIENEVRAGNVLCIDDVMTDKSDTRNGQPISPSDKISKDQRSRYMYDGHYYGGPTCEYYPSISYDRNLFDKYHLYLVRPEVSSDDSYEGLIQEYKSEILCQKYYFLPNDNNKNDNLKSCGPDGEYGTDDDGLPSSLYELIALCEYMKSKTISPFNFTGGYKYYSNFLLSAIYTALQGYDNARGNYTFKGETEIVVGFEDDYLFPGVDKKNNPLSSAKKPITKVVTLSEENGYYSTWELTKYYAEAFMNLCIEQSWFGPSVTNNDDQKSAMYKFVFSDNGNNAKIAMHIDGSYWYNEATEGDNYFEQWQSSNYLNQFAERDVRPMPLPVNVSESVEEGEGKPQALLEMNYGMFVLNKNLESNQGLQQASKDFLKFLYTDAELSAYTAGTSIVRSMNYSLTSEDESKISSYGKYLLKLRNQKGNKVVYFVGDNATFKSNVATFQQTWTNAVFAVSGVANSFYEAIAIEKVSGLTTVEDIFAKQALTKAMWQNMYKGNKSVSDVDGITAIDV